MYGECQKATNELPKEEMLTDVDSAYAVIDQTSESANNSDLDQLEQTFTGLTPTARQLEVSISADGGRLKPSSVYASEHSPDGDIRVEGSTEATFETITPPPPRLLPTLRILTSEHTSRIVPSQMALTTTAPKASLIGSSLSSPGPVSAYRRYIFRPSRSQHLPLFVIISQPGSAISAIESILKSQFCHFMSGPHRLDPEVSPCVEAGTASRLVTSLVPSCSSAFSAPSGCQPTSWSPTSATLLLCEAGQELAELRGLVVSGALHFQALDGVIWWRDSQTACSQAELLSGLRNGISLAQRLQTPFITLNGSGLQQLLTYLSLHVSDGSQSSECRLAFSVPWLCLGDFPTLDTVRRLCEICSPRASTLNPSHLLEERDVRCWESGGPSSHLEATFDSRSVALVLSLRTEAETPTDDHSKPLLLFTTPNQALCLIRNAFNKLVDGPAFLSSAHISLRAVVLQFLVDQWPHISSQLTKQLQQLEDAISAYQSNSATAHSSDWLPDHPVLLLLAALSNDCQISYLPPGAVYARHLVNGLAAQKDCNLWLPKLLWDSSRLPHHAPLLDTRRPAMAFLYIQSEKSNEHELYHQLLAGHFSGWSSTSPIQDVSDFTGPCCCCCCCHENVRISCRCSTVRGPSVDSDEFPQVEETDCLSCIDSAKSAITFCDLHESADSALIEHCVLSVPFTDSRLPQVYGSLGKSRQSVDSHSLSLSQVSFHSNDQFSELYAELPCLIRGSLPTQVALRPRRPQARISRCSSDRNPSLASLLASAAAGDSVSCLWPAPHHEGNNDSGVVLLSHTSGSALQAALPCLSCLHCRQASVPVSSPRDSGPPGQGEEAGTTESFSELSDFALEPMHPEARAREELVAAPQLTPSKAHLEGGRRLCELPHFSLMRYLQPPAIGQAASNEEDVYEDLQLDDLSLCTGTVLVPMDSSLTLGSKLKQEAWLNFSTDSIDGSSPMPCCSLSSTCSLFFCSSHRRLSHSQTGPRKSSRAEIPNFRKSSKRSPPQNTSIPHGKSPLVELSTSDDLVNLNANSQIQDVLNSKLCHRCLSKTCAHKGDMKLGFSTFSSILKRQKVIFKQLLACGRRESEACT